MKISDLLHKIDCLEKKITENTEITDIAYDSRLVKEGSAFFAIAGLAADGRNFALDAVNKGAKLLITEGALFENVAVSQIRVSDIRACLSRLSAIFFNHPTEKIHVVGITGTNGKTTLTYLLEAFWHEASYKTGVIGTINTRFRNHIVEASHTTPESRELQEIFSKMLQGGVTHAAIEVSSHAISLSRVANVEFNCCIFTNLTQDHLDFHKTMDEYYDAKEKLFVRHLKASQKTGPLAIIHGDGVYEARLIKKVKEIGLDVTTFGFSKNNDFYPENYTQTASGFSGDFLLNGDPLHLESSLMGRFNILNVMAAVLAAGHAGLTKAQISKAVKSFTHTPGRLERIKNNQGKNVFVDYAHTPDALKNVMETLSELKERKLFVVFGCGGDRDSAKRPLMGFEAARLGDVVLVTSDNPRTEEPDKIINQIMPGIHRAGLKEFDGQRGFLVEADRKKALEKIVSLARENDIILVAGKGHEDYQIIGKIKTHFSDQEILRELLK